MDENDIISPVEQAGELIPDAVQLVAANAINQYNVAAQNVKDYCGPLSAAILNDITAAIAGCKATCSEVDGTCKACYLAQINEYQSRLTTINSACADSVRKYLDLLMGEAIQNTLTLGVDPPNEDQVLEKINGYPGGTSDVGTINDPHIICPLGYSPQPNPNGTVSCMPDGGNSNPEPENPPPPDDGGTSGGTPPIGGSPAPVPKCPPGTSPLYDPINRDWTCVASVPPPVTPPTGGGGGVPPTLPPVPITPPVPPPGGGITVTPDGCCFVPPPCSDAIFHCEVPYSLPSPKYWAICNTADCNSVKVRLYFCFVPPIAGPGEVVLGPFDEAPDCTKLCVPTLPVCVPPQPPTTPPPTTPPVTPEPPSPFCPPGYHFDDAGNCVKDVTGCLPGYHIDEITGVCTPDDFTCPDGYTFNHVTGVCEKNSEPQTTNPPNIPNPVFQSGLTVCAPDDAVKFYNKINEGSIFQPINQLNNGQVDFGCEPGSVTNPLGYICTFAQGLLNHGYAIAAEYIAIVGCQSKSIVSAFAGYISTNILGGWFGAVPPVVRATSNYALNAACQYIIPDGSNLNSLVVRGFITSDQWTAATAMNGICLPWAELEKEASYTYPNISDAIVANRRGIIDDDSFRNLMLINGVKDSGWDEVYKQVSEYIPSPSDIVRFMVRDVFDPNVVTNLNLDQDFNDKFAGKALDYAKANGMTEDTFRSFWLAHWDLPTAGQMYNALHRIRKDTKLPGSDRIAAAVTTDEVASTLQVADMSPAWVDRLVALSYAPLQKRDFQRLYETKAITDDGLLDALQDSGYSLENAKLLLKMYQKITAQKRALYDGSPSPKEIIAQYDNGGLSRNDSQIALLSAGLLPDQAATRLDIADKMRAAKFQSKSIAAMRKRFLTGDLDVSDVQTFLSNMGLPNDRVAEYVDQWQTELSLKYKQPAIAALCKWATRGYITPADYMRRMLNLGYSPQDASNFINSCLGEYIEKTAKEAAAAVKKNAAEKAAKEKADRKAALDALPCKPAPKPVCTNGQPAGV